MTDKLTKEQIREAFSQCSLERLYFWRHKLNEWTWCIDMPIQQPVAFLNLPESKLHSDDYYHLIFTTLDEMLSQLDSLIYKTLTATINND